eukprot:TRINITY_DN26328_c0_g4_i1.p1 TRINITY_DN26328_c0_g4~~TRINITY_DN26328_c0_g4_i1.p1  ORF type:complete len:412 (-),score=96.19 TRINITY_DN26328_c0_g4_i1:172-1407(-)
MQFGWQRSRSSVAAGIPPAVAESVRSAGALRSAVTGGGDAPVPTSSAAAAETAAEAAASAARVVAAARAAEAARKRRRQEDGEDIKRGAPPASVPRCPGLSAVASAASVFGLEVVDEADAADAAAVSEATAAAAMKSAATSNAMEAQRLLSTGEAAAEKGDFDAALTAWDAALMRAGSGTTQASSTCGNAVAAAVSQVASSCPPMPTSAGLHAAAGADHSRSGCESSSGDMHAGVESMQRLRARIYEAKAQVLLMMPDTMDERAGSHGRSCANGSSILHRAVVAAEAAAIAAPDWAPVWLTLGRTFLAVGLPDRARAAFARAARLDAAMFAAEDGAEDAKDAADLVVRSCVAAVAAERSAAITGSGSCTVAENSVDTDPAKDPAWRVLIRSGRPSIERLLELGSCSTPPSA